MAYRSSTGGGGSTNTSVTLTPPAGLANDDILLFCLYKENAQAVTWPAGFVQLASIAASNSSFTCYVAWKRAASESGNYTASWASGDWNDAILLAYSGEITTGTPTDATTTTQANGSANSVTCPSITTVTNGCDVIFIGGDFDGNAKTPPGGVNLRRQQGDIVAGDLVQASAGATGTKAYTGGGTQQNVGMTVALTPAGGTPGATGGYMTTMTNYWGT